MSRRLHDARVGAELSRRALAEAVGISERAVNYYEDPGYAGARKMVYVRAWAQATGYDFEELWGTDQQPLARTGWFSAIPA